MQAAIADQASTTYQIDAQYHPAFVAHTAAMPDLVGTELQARSAAFLPAVQHGAAAGARLGRLKVLANYLNGNGASAAAGANATERGEFLQRFNAAFADRQNTLPLGTMNANTAPNFHLDMVRAMVDELVNANKHLDASFVAWRGATPDAWRTLLLLREKVIEAGGAATSIYLMIHFLHQNVLPFASLKPDNVMALDRARRSAPANSVFPGFPQWGVGNSQPKSAPTNLLNHFLKHVLDADPLGAALDWKGELPRWWAALNIQLKRRDARTWLGLDAYPFVEGLFSLGSSNTGDDTPLPNAQVETFLEALNAGGRMKQRFKDEMYRAYGPAYRDRSLAAGRAMTNKLVHATLGDANGVYVSGADGDFYVVGRFEGAVLGISACYVASNIANKLAARVPIWALN